MMVTSEFFQSPRRWATGIQMPVDTAIGSACRPRRGVLGFEATKKKTWLAGQGVQFGQFPEASWPASWRASAADVGAGVDRWSAAG
jgi:hypothetical protein